VNIFVNSAGNGSAKNAIGNWKTMFLSNPFKLSQAWRFKCFSMEKQLCSQLHLAMENFHV
jgi:hypothetical protein